MLWLLGCALPDEQAVLSESGDPTVGPALSGDTGAPAPQADFPADGTVLTATATGSPCATGSYTTAVAVLEAMAVGSGTVRFEHHGGVRGCGSFPEAEVVVSLDERSRTAELVWSTGSCDDVICSQYVATVRGFPSGIWRVEESIAGRVDVLSLIHI